MSELTTEAQESLSGSGKSLAVVVLSLLYTVIDNLADRFTLFPFLGNKVQFGIFVPASASIIFGRGIGGLAGGIGELLIEFQTVLQGNSALGSIHLGTVVTSVSLGIGAWLTGFLGKENTREESPSNYRDLFADKEQWRKIWTDVLASIVGLAVTKNFLYAYGSQLQENSSLAGGTAIFLQQFVADSLVLLLVLPFTLVGFDAVQVFLKKREEILEELLLEIDKNIEVENGIKITDVSLPKGVLVQGKWTLVKITFKNMLSEPMAFHLDAVSTSRMYPDTDNTSVIDPEAIWVQSFYVLPSKQDTVNLRIRITPKKSEEFKGVVTHQAIIDITARTKNPSNMTASLLGFSGVNFGVVGISATWDRILGLIGDPEIIFNYILSEWQLIVTTLIAEALLFIPLLMYLYISNRNTDAEKDLRLGFTRGFDYDAMQSRALGFIEKLKDKYDGRVELIIMSLIALGSVTGVGYLGFEAFNLLTKPGYEFQRPMLIFGLALGLLSVWLFGVRGADLVRAIGIGEKKPWEYDRDNVILSFKPLTQLQINTPTEILIRAHNITDRPGVRIVFQGFDSISPQIVELHLDPGEETEFKIAITPLKKAFQDILAISYPLFDYDKKYIDANEAEPFAEQEIRYEVQGQTSLGITKSQQEQLKKGLGVGGFFAVAYSFVALVSPISIPSSFDQFIADNGILFSALQVPFLYVYFYANNKFKSQLT